MLIIHQFRLHKFALFHLPDFHNMKLAFHLFDNEAVSANFNFILSDGYIKKYFDSNKNINKCYANSMIGYEDKFIKGLPLKNKKLVYIFNKFIFNLYDKTEKKIQ